jgi:flavodoxin
VNLSAKNIILTILCFIVGTGVVFSLQNKKINNKEYLSMENKKILIAYFSFSGNTKAIAEKIQTQIGGDIFRIETKIQYPADYDETAYGIAKEQHEKGIKPELKDNGDVSSYDIIFVGTPAWWYEMAPAVKTFLTENNFEGKTIVPFITHGGGGQYQIKEEIGTFAKKSVIKEPFVVYGKGTSSIDEDIEKWLDGLK